jgi:hypothetical protein
MTDAVRLPSESRRCGIQSNSAYLRRPVVAFRKAYEHEGTVMTSPNGRTVRRFTSRDLALVAVFCGIVAALGVVPALHPFGQAVPITAQSMGVMVAGALLGARRAGLALLLFVGPRRCGAAAAGGWCRGNRHVRHAAGRVLGRVSCRRVRRGLDDRAHRRALPAAAGVGSDCGRGNCRPLCPGHPLALPCSESWACPQPRRRRSSSCPVTW